MKKHLLSILLLCTVFVSLTFAQTRQVRGKVTAAMDGRPLIGVSVAVEGTAVGTQTDDNGNYSLAVAPDAILLFSYVGYVSQLVSLKDKTTINIQLLAESAALEEVVVTAMGITRTEKSLGYGSSVLRSNDLTKARETNIINSLAGKAPGVRVTSQSGTLGGSSKVVIRGVNSFDGSNPLWVVDGTPLNNNTAAGGTSSRNIDYGNRIGDLSADDIETMTILKGAAATALYGSRAKDGAIIVTTKKGDKNSNGTVTVNSSIRFERPLILPKFQNDYAQGFFNTETEEFDYDLKYTNGWGPRIEGQLVTDFLGREVPLEAKPNNVKDYFNTGHAYINSISFAGANDKSNYRLGFTSTNETGIIPKTKFDKYNIALNTGTQLSAVLSSQFSGTYSRIKSDGRPAQSSNNANILTSSIYGLPRVVDIHDLANNFEDPITGEQIFLSTDKNGNNPYWIMNYNKNSNVVDRFFGTYNLTFTPLKWLSISNNLGSDIYRELRSSVVRKGTSGIVNGEFLNSELFFRAINNDLIVNIKQDDLLKDVKFNLILGNNINDRQSESTSILASNLTIDQLWNYPNAASTTPSRSFTKRRIVGVFGDLGVSYKDYLFLNITGRNDWSSTLPLNNRSYFYPSVSSSFVFTDAFKDKLPDWINYGKVRASWAQVGSDLDAFQLDYQYSPVSSVFMQYIGSSTTVFPFGDISTAFTGPKILPNYDLRPQRQNSIELGAELKLLDSRVGIDFNYYNSATKDQLIPLDIALSTGYFAKYVNVGLVRNKGVELALNLIPLKSSDFTWGFQFNFSKNMQSVERLVDGLDFYVLESGFSGLRTKAYVGESFGLYGSAFLRDEETGKYIIDAESGLRKTIDDQRLGNLYPDWMLGASTFVNYKSWSLSALVDIRKGGVFYSGTVGSLRTSGLAIETTADRTQPIIDEGLVDHGNGLVENDVPVVSHELFWSQNYKSTNTEANVFDASYVKLREVRIGYALPQRLLGTQKFIKAADLAVEGRNLWLIKSKVPHVDPESNFFGAGSVGEGVEFNSIPSTRSFGLNIRLTF